MPKRIDVVKRVVRAVWVGVVVLCGACDPPGLPPSGTPAGTTGTAGTTAASGSESTADTPPADPALARAGEAVFARACGRCHQGDEPSGGTLANLRLTTARMEDALFAGSEDHSRIMPVVPPDQLPASDIPALRAYLRSINARR